MTINSLQSCKLCTVISNPLYTGQLRPCDTPFHKTSSFLALPALGPLCIGHAMIVSRKHFASLLNMDSIDRAEFEVECAALSALWPNEALTFAEHGASCFDNSGPCIAHTHVNVIPNVAVGMLDLSQFGHNLIATGPLHTLPKMSDAYFLIGQQGCWSLYDTAAAPSQYIRKLLYLLFNLPHWDWRLFPNEELATATLERWQALVSL